MKRFLLSLLVLTLSVGLWALDNVLYVDADGTVKYANNVTEVTSSGSDVTWNAGWYVVTDADVQIAGSVTCNGAVHLILADGASLKTNTSKSGNNPGIRVEGSNSFAVYGQTSQPGRLTANGGDGGAGIGGGFLGSGSNITINGGTVTATGGDAAAGIGGGLRGSGDNITINGGTVTATSGNGGAGIGGGSNYGSGSDITINGGTVTATSAGIGGGAGIGGALIGSGDNITINGGTVTANGSIAGGAGIGGGVRGSGSNITINGGTVTANGGSSSSGIGGGAEANGSNIRVSESRVIVAGSSADDAVAIAHTSGDDLASSLTDKRYAAVIETPGPTLISGTYAVTRNMTYDGRTSGTNGLIIASGATVTIDIAKGCTLRVVGANGSGKTAGKAAILLPSGATLNVIGRGVLQAVGGNAGNGAKGGEGKATYDGQSDGKQWFTSTPGSGGNGGGGAGAGIGTDGSAGANGQSTNGHKYNDYWNDNTTYADYPHTNCLGAQQVQASSSPAACGTLNISATITAQLTGGSAGTAGAKGTQGGCRTNKGTSFDCDIRCGAGGAGGGGGAGGSAAGYGTGGRGGYGGSYGLCGVMKRLRTDNQNSSWEGSSHLQGAQGTTGTSGSTGSTKTAGTLYQLFVSFDANGGLGSMNEQEVYESSSNLSTNTFIRANHSFTGWNIAADGSGTAFADAESVTASASFYGEKTLYAQWLPFYTITFKNYDGSTLQAGDVAYGETPIYSGATPTRAEDAEYTYTFSGWTPAVAAVTGAATYTATFDATRKSYGITFKNYDGSTLQAGDVLYGETPVYSGATPTRAEDAEYTYTFSGWTPAVAAVTGAATYTATFDIKKKVVPYVDADGTTQYANDVAVVTSSGSDVTWDAGWYVVTDADVQIAGSVICNGAVHLILADGASLKTNTSKSMNKPGIRVEGSNSFAVYGQAGLSGRLTANGGQFAAGIGGGDRAVGSNITINGGIVTAIGNYGGAGIGGGSTAAGQNITINGGIVTATAGVLGGSGIGGGIDNNGSNIHVSGSYAVKAGSNAGDAVLIAHTSEDDLASGLSDKKYVFVTKNVSYSITFVNYDSETLQAGDVLYGEMPVYSGATPTKAEDAGFTYTFSGWTPAVAAVTGAATYTATFDATRKAYSITFKNYDGSTLQSGDVLYGETPVYSGATPTRAEDAEFTYTFSGWTPAVAAVTGAATYTATFDATRKAYSITFKNYDGSTLQESDVLYGETPVYSGATPTKAEEAEYTYTFSGWTPAVAAVTGAATYTATFYTREKMVPYVDADGTVKYANGATEVTSSGSDVTWNAGWYVVFGADVQITGGVTCNGAVHLILVDGASLSTNTSRSYHTPGILVTGSNSLTIYGQTSQTGRLTANGGDGGAGIGGGFYSSGDNITINGGTVTANGGKDGAGIGGGTQANGSNLTINGGTVIATGGVSACGIGGGSSGTGSNITINGGTVTANSGESGSGIGGGYYRNGFNITINGGTVTANGCGIYSSGIGGGSNGSGDNITINSGTVTANGGFWGAGIGGGPEGSGSNITINGGTVTANGGGWAAGIGGGHYGSGSNITITGGTVTANGGDGASGIGGGAGRNGSNIRVSESRIIVAGSSADDAVAIAHTSGDDLASILTARQYVAIISPLQVPGSTLTSGTYTLDSNSTLDGRTSGTNGLIIASGATVTIDIAKGCTLRVVGANGSGKTAGKAAILLPSGATLNVIGRGVLQAVGGNAGNGAKGGEGKATYDGQSNGQQWFTSTPGSGGNGGGGAGAGIGTDGSAGANGQSTNGHKYNDYWEDRTVYNDYPHTSCLAAQAIQASSTPAACGTLNVSTTITLDIRGGSAGTAGAKGTQGGCRTNKGTKFDCDIRCGAGGAGGGGGAGGSGAGYGTGGRGGYGGSYGLCGVMKRLKTDDQNSSWEGSSHLQGAQGTTGTNGSTGSTKTAGTLYQLFVSFDANGGLGSMNEQEVYESSSNLSTNTFIRAKHSFTGWNIAADGSGTAFADAESVTASASFYGEKTLYAQWLPFYTITFKNYDGSTLQAGDVLYGETPIYSGATPTRAEDAEYTYTFSGWTPAVAAVTGAATYTATFDATAKDPLEINLTPNHSAEQNGYFTTFYYGASSYEVPAGVTIYTAAIHVVGDETFMTMAELGGNIIPAGTAVILKATEAGALTLHRYDGSTDGIDVSGNDLQGVDSDTPASSMGSAPLYTLAAEGGVMAFYHFVGATLRAHKAFLQLPASAPAPHRITMGCFVATEVENINADATAQKIFRDGHIYILRDGKTYTAQGQLIN